MKHTFTYADYSYDYTLEYGNRKRLTLIVKPSMEITVRAPFDTSSAEISAFMVRKWQWLEKQLSEFRSYRRSAKPKKYVSGESWYYLGRQYMLEVIPSKDKKQGVRLTKGKMWLQTLRDVHDTQHNKNLLSQWYQSRRHQVYRREFLAATKHFDLESLPKIEIKPMKKRWGSYTKTHTVILNTQLIYTPVEAIRYVIVHELCHTISRYHDDIFYTELDKRLPNWRDIKRNLEQRHG